MKLRSHEILAHPLIPNVSAQTSSASSSRFKQLFQRKVFFKKKSASSSSSSSASSNARHQIPAYVRKSLLRFLIEPVRSPPAKLIQQQSPSRHAQNRPPVMGIQALKTRTNNKQTSRRSSRTRLQPIVNDTPIVQPFDEVQIPNNYDMTILHLNLDEETSDHEDSTIFASHTSTNQKKIIPQWARKNELQIAICNQIYFHRNPSEIFGNSIDCSPANLRTILHSMLPNVELVDDDRSLPIANNRSILV